MPEETKSKRKKTRKFGYYLYAVVIIVLTIVNITLATLLLTHVQDIKVVGSQLSDKQDVIAWIREDKLTRNSLYTYFKFKAGAHKLPVYLEDVKVQLSAPWEVKVIVTEKKIIGSTILDETYVYLADGKIRTLSNLKKKKRKHVQVICDMQEMSGVDDVKIKRRLKLFDKE